MEEIFQKKKNILNEKQCICSLFRSYEVDGLFLRNFFKGNFRIDRSEIFIVTNKFHELI